MAKKTIPSSLSIIPFLITILSIPLLFASSLPPPKQVYVVYFGEHGGQKAFHEIEEGHRSYLEAVKESKGDAADSLLYSYKHSINGFAALLTPAEASKLSELEEVVSVYPSQARKYKLHTTRSWEFSGLDEATAYNPSFTHQTMGGKDLLVKTSYGKDVIIGVLDSGVWPESKSFSDHGMDPVPKSWKGVCQTGDLFNSSHCNRKIIGARYYQKGFQHHYGLHKPRDDYASPRDADGHGTHTASTVAGRSVPDASFIGGLAGGLASGGAPHARLAIYKACWAIPNQPKADGNTCVDEDMLAAMDDAIADGVHVLSISIGFTSPLQYVHDSIAVGALHAVKRNIVVACSAGNSGPKPSTLSNVAPWIITVGASSLDRMFPSSVVLGNGVKVLGETVTPFKLANKIYPLVYAGDVSNHGVAQNLTGQCSPGSLSTERVKGKIVVCLRGGGVLRVAKGVEVKRAGGAAMILANTPELGSYVPVDAHFLPATAVGATNAAAILCYINSTRNPTATIIPPTTALNTKPAPFMASFSSQGPSTVDPYILKPDIAAPGLNILAAWSMSSSPTKLPNDQRRVAYNIYSGTSMACPHVSGAAALLKAAHPDWSSAAIRSALITTAGLTNNMGQPISDGSGKPASPFQLGSGYFRPAKAADPGLVYDSSYTDYLLYLCGIGVRNIDPTFRCPRSPPSPVNLNYPSIAIPKLKGSVKVKRTVTNVGGEGKSVYLFSAKPPEGLTVKATPSILEFSKSGEKKKFTVTVTVTATATATNGSEVRGKDVFGSFTWADGIHTVRSTMAVSFE